MRIPIVLVAASALLPVLASASNPPPEWVKSGGISSSHPADRCLVGFAMAPDNSMEAARNKAAGDLATRITVRIEQQTTSQQGEANGKASYAIASLTRATADVRLTNLAYETWSDDTHAYALAWRDRQAAATERRSQRDDEIAKARALLAKGETAQADKRTSDALAAYYAARVAIATASDHDAIARAINPSGGAASGDIFALASANDDHIRALLKRSATDVADAVSSISLQLSQQGLSKQARLTIAPLSYGSTPFSSAFGRDLSQRLEQSLAQASGGTITGDMAVRGAYVPEAETWRVSVLVREASSGRAVASAEAVIPKAAVPAELPTLPQNFDQAMKDERLLGEGETVSGDLHLEVWTNKGRSNLVYSEHDVMQLYFRVNKPAYVRATYLLATGEKVMMEQAYFIDSSKVNQAVEYPDKFEVSSPFGVERLYAVAFTEKPEPLPTRHVKVGDNEYDVVESADSLVKHRGFTRKSAGAQTSEATVALTTMPK